MLRNITLKILAVTALVLVLVCSNVFAQGRSDQAFERVREVQERNTERLMNIPDVEGTAIGLDENGQPALVVMTAQAGVAGIPRNLEGVNVKVVITGKFYSFPKPNTKPPKPTKDRTPPPDPTGLSIPIDGVTSDSISLDWNDYTEPVNDFDQYNIYRSNSFDGLYIKVGSSDISEYTDTGLASSTTYYYTVTAVDTSKNESGNSNIVGATTLQGTIEPTIGIRPAPIGVSTGHFNITAGTIGCRVKDILGNVYALSNNHVYADENQAGIGDNVLQPGPYDGGENPRDAIGVLTAFRTIVFSRRANNTIDAAIALCPIENLDNKTPDGSYGIPNKTTTTASVGMAVQKHGRTTGRTFGSIYLTNATVNVSYDSGTARFINQLVITPGTFSNGGDSGSLIVTNDDDCNPVGLLFAGSSLYTIANPIDAVLDYFDVTIDGK